MVDAFHDEKAKTFDFRVQPNFYLPLLSRTRAEKLLSYVFSALPEKKQAGNSPQSLW